MDFYESQIAELLVSFKDSVKMVGFISFIAIVIACLGLLGIAAYQAESRVKEIGIRKVLGASPQQIVLLLSRGFFVLLLVAIIVAIPLTWLLTDSWLSQFAYHINLSPWYFAIGIFAMLGLGILTVGSQAITAALRNPIDALRSE
jgi:putative ABC transport system permease protein